MRVLFFGFLHIPRTCTTFAHVAVIFYFRYSASNFIAHILQMLQKFHIFPGHLYTHESHFSSCSAHPQDMYYLCTAHVPVIFYFTYLATNSGVNILQMLQKFHIFPGHLYTHESPLSCFSAHPQNMYYLCICCWRISLRIFNCQFSCANPADALGILHFFEISIWFFPQPFIWTPGSPHEV